MNVLKAEERFNNLPLVTSLVDSRAGILTQLWSQSSRCGLSQIPQSSEKETVTVTRKKLTEGC